jgi:peptide/nickel transport system ATP-binding protein
LTAPLLEVSGLSLELGSGRDAIRLLDDVSFNLYEGQVLGLVGESGSGKSLTCRSIMRLLPPNIRITSGVVKLAGKDIAGLSERELEGVRGRQIGMIFQNPTSFLDPVMRVGDQVAEVLRVHEGLSPKEADLQAVELFKQVGIPDPAQRLRAYAHEFSGGMRQRVTIAAALACRPRILIADEPTTALDVTIQAQILQLLLDLKERFGLSIILISHDLGVISQCCDQIVVMYAGRVAEQAPKDQLLDNPKHPYSQGLIGSQPDLAEPGTLLPSIPGQPPSSTSLGAGCHFKPRCRLARDRCATEVPALTTVGQGHCSACHYWDEVANL